MFPVSGAFVELDACQRQRGSGWLVWYAGWHHQRHRSQVGHPVHCVGPTQTQAPTTLNYRHLVLHVVSLLCARSWDCTVGHRAPKTTSIRTGPVATRHHESEASCAEVELGRMPSRPTPVLTRVSLATQIHQGDGVGLQSGELHCVLHACVDP